jgi:hypothetical protein
MEEMHCSQHAEKLLFYRIWEGKDRSGPAYLNNVIHSISGYTTTDYAASFEDSDLK